MPLKAQIKQTIVINSLPEAALSQLQANLEPSWDLQSETLSPDTISFLAQREGVQVKGQLERWQGTETRLQINGKVSLNTAYETWREWTGVTSFLALAAIWILVSVLPLTAPYFAMLYSLMWINPLMINLSMLFLLGYFLGLPFLIYNYFTKFSPDVRLSSEAQRHLANFLAQVKSLETIAPNTSRIEIQDQAENFSESLDSQSKAEVQRTQFK
jgi:hypothetical protein